jgi:hypothetical protein
MYVLSMEPARYTGSFVPGEVLLLVRNFGGGKQSFFFLYGQKIGHKWASGPGMFRNIMVFMICTMGAIVELQEGHADLQQPEWACGFARRTCRFTTSGMGMWICKKDMQIYNIRNGHVDLEQTI